MNEAEKFSKMFGGIFFSIGLVLTVAAVLLLISSGEWGAAGFIFVFGFVFGGVGAGFLLSALKASVRRRRVEKRGIRYSGKIYGYVEDKSCTMNNDYLINIRVRYFDTKGIEREAVIPTGFTRGSGDYPLGATIDFMAAGSQYSWDRNSVRYEKLEREEELMDNKPLYPMELETIAVSCPNCGASFIAAKGYASECPYCGGALKC